MAFDAQLPGTEPDGQTDGLRNVQHRNIDPAPEVAVDRRRISRFEWHSGQATMIA